MAGMRSCGIQATPGTVAYLKWYSAVSKTFMRRGTPKIILDILRNPCLWKRKRQKMLAHGDYSNISNCRTKILVIFRGLFIIFAAFQNTHVLYLFHYFSRNHKRCSVDPCLRNSFKIMCCEKYVSFIKAVPFLCNANKNTAAKVTFL